MLDTALPRARLALLIAAPALDTLWARHGNDLGGQRDSALKSIATDKVGTPVAVEGGQDRLDRRRHRGRAAGACGPGLHRHQRRGLRPAPGPGPGRRRRDGRLLFKADAFVPQKNLFTPPQPGERVVVSPGIAGGANWSPSAYDADRALFFVGAQHLPTRSTAHRTTRPDGSVLEFASSQNVDECWGTLSALDLAHGGRMAWQVKTDEPLTGGVLATASGLVFSGAGEGLFAAFDGATDHLRGRRQTVRRRGSRGQCAAGFQARGCQ